MPISFVAHRRVTELKTDTGLRLCPAGTARRHVVRVRSPEACADRVAAFLFAIAGRETSLKTSGAREKLA